MSVFARLTTPGARRSRTCSPQARCWVAITTQGRADSASPSSPAGWPGGSPHASDAEPMRAEVEKIVGAAAVDERPVRDLWPAATMAERAGETPERVLVVRPSGREQLAAILRWATANAVMVTPMGGASGVCGALAPKRGELVLDMGGLDRILEIDELNLTCRVESGVNGMTLEKTLNEKGLTLGHYPSSLPGTTIGGLVSTRSSGQESSRYGSIEDMVLSLAVVLPDGTFAAPRPGPRSAVGPALHELWLGAEGALGEDPWHRWQEHRFGLSAEWLKGILEPPGSYVDTIELAAPWTVLPQLHESVKTAIAVGGVALCHFSHAYEQGCCAYFSFAGAADREEDARAAYSRAWEGAMSAALEMGATISHHHGTGQARARWVADDLGGWMRA